MRQIQGFNSARSWILVEGEKVKIKDLLTGSSIADKNYIKRIITCVGIRQYIRVIANGRTIECGIDQMIMVEVNGFHCWCNANELVVGDKAVMDDGVHDVESIEVCFLTSSSNLTYPLFTKPTKYIVNNFYVRNMPDEER